MWKPEKKDIRVVWNDNHSANKPVVVLPASGTSDENRQLVREDMSMPILLFVLLIRCVMLMLENMALKTENQNLKNQNVWLSEQLRRFNYEKYVGKNQQIEGQIMFPEVAEMPVETKEEAEPEKVEVKGYTKIRKPRGKSLTSIATDYMEEEIVDIYSEECTCPICNSELFDIGIKDERPLLTIIPAHLKLIRQRTHSRVCPCCKKNATENLTIYTGTLPPAVIPGSFATGELISHVVNEKILMGSPLYRLEKYFKIKGIAVSRQDMDNWLFAAADLLIPVYDRLVFWFKQSNVGHADETPTLCLHTKEKGGKKKKCYTWVYRSGRFEEHQVVIYKFFPGRKQEYYKEFIKGYQGYLITDGLQVYHDNDDLPDVIIVGCWQHAQAKFKDAAKFGDVVSGAASYAVEALKMFKEFFDVEKRIKDMEEKQRLAERLKYSKPIADKLKQWIDKMKAKVLPKSLLGKAINYALNEWEYMVKIFESGSLDATNNSAERAVKDFVLARKNFLFVNVEKGGTVISTFSSFIASAYANELDPEKYIAFLLNNIRLINSDDPDELDKLMPWNAPEECKIPGARKARENASASSQEASGASSTEQKS